VTEQSNDAGNDEPATGNGEERTAEAGTTAEQPAEAGGSSDEAGGGEVAVEAPEPAGASSETTAQSEGPSQETPAGWFQDPNVPNQQRYWDGSTWTDQTKGTDAGISTTKRSADERKAFLAQHIQGAAARGMRVESQSDFQAVMVEGQPVNHVLHAIITIFSCGLWGIAWIILAITGGEKRAMVVVDEFGNVQLQKLGKA
jgi:Protein of unknown function (DUF2510)